MFWTDTAQASERLHNSVVNYDGKPTYIEDVFTSNDNVPSCHAMILPNSERKVLSLADEKWNNFRDLPRLGWFNYVSSSQKRISPVLLERRAVNSRIHGLCANNVSSYQTARNGLTKERAAYITEYVKNAGYLETMHDESAFPKLSEILMSLDNNPGGVAFSSKFCVVVTEEGMKWLYRKSKRIGLFTGADSLNLFPKNGFYKEELQGCPSFDITNVREF